MKIRVKKFFREVFAFWHMVLGLFSGISFLFCIKEIEEVMPYRWYGLISLFIFLIFVIYQALEEEEIFYTVMNYMEFMIGFVLGMILGGILV